MVIFFLVVYVQQTGLGDVTASWILRRKFISGKPYLFFFVFMLTCFCVSLLSNAMAATFIMLNIYKTINNISGLKKTAKKTVFS